MSHTWHYGPACLSERHQPVLPARHPPLSRPPSATSMAAPSHSNSHASFDREGCRCLILMIRGMGQEQQSKTLRHVTNICVPQFRAICSSVPRSEWHLTATCCQVHSIYNWQRPPCVVMPFQTSQTISHHCSSCEMAACHNWL